MATITDEQYNIASPYFAESNKESEDESMTFVTTLRSLPASIRTFLLSIDTAIAILALGREYSLDTKQLSVLARTVREFVIGKLTLGNMISSLPGQLGLDTQVTTNIVNELLQKIIQPIMGDVKKIQEGRPVGPATPPPIPKAEGLYSEAPSVPTLPPSEMGLQSRGSSISQPRSSGGEIGKGFKVPDIEQKNVIDLRQNN